MKRKRNEQESVMEEEDIIGKNNNSCGTNISNSISNSNDTSTRSKEEHSISCCNLPLFGRGIKTHQHLLDRYKTTVLKEKTRLIDHEKKKKSVSKSSNQNLLLDERSDGNNDDDVVDDDMKNMNEKEEHLIKGWTMEDMLHMNVEHDCFPEDYGINFTEDGYQSIHDDSLVQHMTIPQISDLVGFANSASTVASANENNNNDSNLTMTNNSTKASINHLNNTTIHVNDSSSNDKEAKKKEYDTFVETRMWHMSNTTTPPKPSHLDFLLQCASYKTLQSQTEAEQIYKMYQESCKPNSVDDRADDNTLDVNNNSCSATTTTNNSTIHDKSDILNQNQTVIVQNTKTNNAIEENAKESLKRKSKQLEKLYNQFDETALVALGMFMEESFIASLLPLACDHVTRCRYLEKRKMEEGNDVQYLVEKKKKEKNNHNKEIGCDNNDHDDDDVLEDVNDPFTQWILPAEEAISNLAVHSSGINQCKQQTSQSMNTPSKKPPQNHVNTFKSHQELRNWCVAHEIDQKFALNNLDLLKSFFHHPSKQALHDLYHSNQSKCVRDVKKSLMKASSQNNDEFLDDHIDKWSIPEIHVDADK